MVRSLRPTPPLQVAEAVPTLLRVLGPIEINVANPRGYDTVVQKQRLALSTELWPTLAGAPLGVLVRLGF